MRPRWRWTAPEGAGEEDPADGLGGGRSGGWTVAVQVGQFALAGVLALLLVGYATSVASRRVGEREAIVNARATTVVKAQGVVEPAVTEGLLTGKPDAVRRVGEVVERDVLDDSLVRVRIWTPEGTVVYSDEPRSIGLEYELGPDELESLETGVIEAEVSDLAKPENRYERGFGKLLEVYLPIRTPEGRLLLFEAYYRYDAVEASGAELWRSFAPIALGALVLLELVQIPLAWSLARRLRQRLREREGLLRRALDASEVERRQIAADLHDGVVQDLAGVHYALAAAARSEGPPGPGDADGTRMLEDTADTVRESIKALRSLLVEIYPPNIEEEGLASTLSDLLARSSARGVDAELDTAELREPLPTPVAGLLYRVAQEGVRNALNHADARTLRVRVSNPDRSAVIEVIDDGRGFESAGDGPPAEEGHFGLRGLAGLVADAGGTLDVRSAPGEGTTLRVEVPL
jgi:signal transduction histidine kinase